MLQRPIIVGSGALGVALAVALENLGEAPGCIGRGGPVSLQATFEGTGEVNGRRLALKIPTKDLTEASMLLMAVKAFDLAKALSWTEHLAAGTPVISLCNGAVENILREAALRRPDLIWRLGYCTLGISVIGKDHYALRSSSGEIAFGPLGVGETNEPTAAEKRLLATGSPFRWHAGILWLSRRKWLFNTVINTLTAAKKLKQNGDLLADLATLAAVFNEGWELGRELWGEWPLAKDQVYKTMVSLIEATSANENSMARDVRLGRKTEAAFLSGLAKDKKKYPLLVELTS